MSNSENKQVEERFQVWHLTNVKMDDNTINVDLGQTWRWELIKTFATKEEAEEHVMTCTRSDPETCNAVGKWTKDMKTDAEKTAFLRQFCFTNDLYLYQRRYFVGKPQYQWIVDNLITGAGLLHKRS